MLAGLKCGVFGSALIGLIEVQLFPSINSLIVPALIVLGVLLFAWDWIKPLLSAAFSKAKSLIPKPSNRRTPAPQTPTSARVILWEQLYESCDPKHGACPKAREMLTEMFQYLAPCPPEATK